MGHASLEFCCFPQARLPHNFNPLTTLLNSSFLTSFLGKQALVDLADKTVESQEPTNTPKLYQAKAKTRQP